jgi:hypothetical protein
VDVGSAGAGSAGALVEPGIDWAVEPGSALLPSKLTGTLYSDRGVLEAVLSAIEEEIEAIRRGEACRPFGEDFGDNPYLARIVE